MKTTTRLIHSIFFSSPRAQRWCVAGALLLATSSHAAIWSWSGGGGANAYWNNSANWGFAGIPANGDTVIFPASQPNLLNTNNIATLVLNQIRFVGAGGGYDIRGNAFTLTNNILATNTVGANTIENNINLATAANVTIAVSNGASLLLSGTLSASGAVGVNKTGLGTLTYQSPVNNPYTGTTTVTAGTLQLNVSGIYAYEGPLVIGDGSGTGSPTVQYLQGGENNAIAPITVNLGGLLNLNNFSDTLSGLTIQGGTVSSGIGTLILNGNIVTVAAPNQATINGNLSFIGVSPTITVPDGGAFYDLYVNANIYDNGHGLLFTNTVPGSSFTVLAGSNTLTGPVILNNLIVSPITSYSLGATNPVTVGGAGTLFLYSSAYNTSKTLTLQAGANLTSQYNNTWNGPIVLGGNATINGFTAGGVVCTLNLAGGISGTGNIFVTADNSVWSLLLSGSAANTFSGDLSFQTGTLLLNKGGFDEAIPQNLFIGDATHSATNRLLAVNQINNASTVTLYNGSLLDLNNNFDGIGALVLYGASVTTGTSFLDMYPPATITALQPASSVPVISGTIGLQTAVTITTSNNLTMNAQVYSTGNLIKTGPNNLFLTASNTYSGLTLVQQGWVWARNSMALGSTNGGTVVSSGATLVLDTGVGITNETLTLNGPSAGAGWGSLDVENGINSWAGPIINNGSSTLDAWNVGSELHIIGPISGTGSLELFNYASFFGGTGGTQFFEGSAANTYTGATTVDTNDTLVLAKTSFSNGAIPGSLTIKGTVRLGAADQIANTANVVVNNGGLFDTSVYFELLDVISGFGTVNFGSGGYLEIGINGGNSEFDGNFTGTGYVFGYSVGKTGSGTFTIGGNSSYTAGITHVYNGKLVINGSQLSIPVTVDSGATLAGTGTVGSITANGIVAPGNGGPGVLSCSNIFFGSTGTYLAQIINTTQGSGYSLLNPLIQIGSNILGNATLQVAPAFSGPPVIGQQFTVISNATPNQFSGIFNGVAEGGSITASGYKFGVSYIGGTGNDLVLTLQAIPGNTVTLNAVDSGWYDSTGLHMNGNKNYYLGNATLLSNTNLYRNYLVFNIPTFTNAIVHAELFINNYVDISQNGQETYMLHKVSTPIANLEAGGSGLTGIYNDLGAGAVYALRNIATNESSQKSIIPLNAQFINDATVAMGGQLAMGGLMASLAATNNHSQSLFGFSGSAASDVQLRLTYGTNLLLTSANHGWYNSSGTHLASNPNYLAGDDGATQYRDYFVFNLPAVSSQLIDAQLLLNSYTNTSPYGVETFQLYDVTNSIATVTSSQSTATNIFADLGSGNVYGGRDVYVSESGQTASIPLNGNFLVAAQAGSGSSIALGGAVTSLNPVPTLEELFGFSSGSTPADAKLWLGFLTAPITHPAFVGTTPVYLGNNQYQLTLSGNAGTSYEIQGTFDFQRWDYITDVKLSGVSQVFTYSNNAAVPYRFFRAEQLQ